MKTPSATSQVKMSSLLNALASNATFLKSLQMTNIVALTNMSGISVCLYAWIIPILLVSHPTRTTIKQFNIMIHKGLTYLLPSSRVMSISLASTAYLLSQSPNPEVAAKWRYWAIVLVILVPIAPYEMLAIFPINQKIAEIGERVEKDGSDRLSEAETEEVKGLIRKWQKRHIGRMLLPFAASLIGFWTVIF